MKPDEINENSLPANILDICRKLNAPPRLIAHLTLVYDVAGKLKSEIELGFPGLPINYDEVLFGAATHDIGKAVFKEELIDSGNRHEERGVELLKKYGISASKARFAYTHANWNSEENIELEDLLVALADNCWKGKRNEPLESLITAKIAAKIGKESWEAFLTLDEILQRICADADRRLNWQAQFSAEI